MTELPPPSDDILSVGGRFYVRVTGALADERPLLLGSTARSNNSQLAVDLTLTREHADWSLVLPPNEPLELNLAIACDTDGATPTPMDFRDAASADAARRSASHGIVRRGTLVAHGHTEATHGSRDGRERQPRVPGAHGRGARGRAP